ncbi:Uncharacterized protein YutD [Lactobacillus bombicola]|uniref:Uncharacterized protein YutD n=1 Tax=Lactobacillus bombicola TaxID=1505723 RepID=A0A1I1T6G0_9LACO|nr:YutD family protein [Lactobacillus bombicola]SFD54214.1 Uncharacterized protein YutD [Lactobacillus bombicola]
MMEKEMAAKTTKGNKENRFVKEQPLRHPLAVVTLNGNHLKINKQSYQIVVNKQEALSIEVLRQKYDPYLDQYDFLVGDVSSEHLRLKGFYKDNVQATIDRREQTIADYLMEYCNPGAGYFILKLLSPVHHYRSTNSKKQSPSQYRRRKKVKIRSTLQHNFIIKKRKSSN